MSKPTNPAGNLKAQSLEIPPDSVDRTETRPKKRCLVVTTISPPNAILQEMAEVSIGRGIRFIVVGDTKSPRDFQLPGAEFYDIAAQTNEFPKFAKALPTRHYARKNIDYLLAIRDGADLIQETDDDNIPFAAFWDTPPGPVEADVAVHDGPWLNVYSLFTPLKIWPRGYPLDYVSGSLAPLTSGTRQSRGLIVQGMADENPDVDAVYRLLFPLPVKFQPRNPVVLESGTWCPFNSQNTAFRREVFPLLYLPSFCSFRMTDIWRSFVAQRCLWELSEGVLFTSATVRQERNKHSLIRDFEAEVPGYLQNDALRKVLEDCPLQPSDTLGNLVKCYKALCARGFLMAEELSLVRLWTRELKNLLG